MRADPVVLLKLCRFAGCLALLEGRRKDVAHVRPLRSSVP